MDNAQQYKSQAARDAQAMGYGDKSYWDYLEKSASEHYAYRSDVYPNGIENAYTQSLSEALMGNEGD